MIDPLRRWASVSEKPDYAGPLSYGGAPYTQDATDLEGADVAIVGAPMDELVSDRPGTRFTPRAMRAASCPHGPQLGERVHLRLELRVVDYGDVPLIPADPLRSHAAIKETVGQVLAAGAIPMILGGDHSITEPDVRACVETQGSIGLVHFDTQTDTGAEVFGARLSHETIMRRLVEEGNVDPKRYVQIGLHGYWPGDQEFAWQRERSITSLFMHEVRDLGIKEVMGRAIAAAGAGPVFLTVYIDVLDPAFAPGTGSPKPGGMTTAELLWAVREVATRLDLVGANMVEAIPTSVGSADITALAADRIVREILGGIAMHRNGTRES